MLIAPGRDAPGSTSFEDTYIGCGKSILTTKHFEDGGKFFRAFGARGRGGAVPGLTPFALV